MAVEYADKAKPCMLAQAGFSVKDVNLLEARVARLNKAGIFEDQNHVYLEAATQIAAEARAAHGRVLKALDAEDAPKPAAPQRPMSTKSMHDNVPDLIEAVIAEHKIPKRQGQAYYLHAEEGKSHDEIAAELGVGKTTVQNWLERLNPLMKEARMERLRGNRLSEGEADPLREPHEEHLAPEEAHERGADPHESDAGSGAEATRGEQPAVDQRAPGDESATRANDEGELTDLDTGGHEGDTDPNINTKNSPYAEGKTRADNNIDKDRKKELTAHWDALNEKMPKDHRVEFKNLGSAQQDAFDSSARLTSEEAATEKTKPGSGAERMAKRMARAHEQLTESVNQGVRYNRDAFGPTSLGKVRYEDDPAGVLRQSETHDSVRYARYDRVELNGDSIEVQPLRAPESQHVAAAVVELTQHVPEGQPFFNHAIGSIDALNTFEAPKDGAFSGVSGLYYPGANTLLVERGGSPSERAATLGHELAHTADYGAGSWASPESGGRAATTLPESQFAFHGFDVDPVTGEPKPDTGAVMAEALRMYERLTIRTPQSTFGLRAYERLSYALGPLDAAQELHREDPVQHASSVERMTDTMSVELLAVMTELRLEHPLSMARHMPLAYDATTKLFNATSHQEVFNAIAGAEHARNEHGSVIGDAGETGAAEGGQPAARAGDAAPRASRSAGEVRKPLQDVPEDRVARAVRGADQTDSSSAEQRGRDGADAQHGPERAGGLNGSGGKPPEPPKPPSNDPPMGRGLPPLDKPGGLAAFARSITGEGLKLYRNFPSLLGILSTEQLADRFQEMPQVHGYSDTAQRMGGLANQLIGAANPVIRAWAAAAREHGEAKAAAFGKLLDDSTTRGMWPSKDWMHADHAFLRPKAPDPLKATAAEMAEYQARIAPLAALHAELVARWKNTPQSLRDLYPQIEKVNRDNYDRKVAAARKNLIETYHPSAGEAGVPSADTIDRAAAISKAADRKAFLKAEALDDAGTRRVKELWESVDDHKSDYDNKLEGPYFTKSRFGEHIVSYKSPEFHAAEKAYIEARDAVSGEDRGSLNQQRQDAADDTASIRRSLKRATSPESIARHTAALAEAEAHSEALEASRTAALKTMRERSTALNNLKADDNHYAVEFHENRETAKQREAQLKAFFAGSGVDVKRSTRDLFFSKPDGLTPAYVKRISDRLVGSLEGADADSVRRSVREMYIQSLPGSSALKNQLKRRNVPGVRADEMQRGFASKSIKDAHTISRMVHMSELHQHTNDLRFGDDTNEDAKIVGNELAKRTVLNADTKSNKAISFATNFTYMAQLGLSPGFMLQQATQQWVNTAPMMAARHGVGSATSELAKGTAHAAKMLKVSFDKAKSKMDFAVDLDAAQTSGLITPNESALLHDMFNRGRIDISSSHDAGIAARPGAMDTFSRASQMANWPVQQLEVLNRISTALAGYRAEAVKAAKDGKNADEAHLAAMRYADRLVSETHMNYASENRARFIHPNSWGGWGRVMFQFRAYQQGMGYLTAKNILDGMRGDKEAMKAGAYMTGMQLATAGVAGLPIPGAMVAVATAVYKLFTNDDEEKDPKEMFYQGLKSAGGEVFANAVTKGIPAALGVDVSGKLGAGTTFDVAPFVRNQKDGRDMTAAYFMSIVGGAAGGQVANLAEALHLAGKGEYAKAAMMMPGKAVTDIIKAEEYQRVGTKDSRGNTILEPEDVSLGSSVIRGLGLAPTALQRVQDERSAFFTARTARNDVRTKLLADYAHARVAGEDTGDIMDAIHEFNDRHHDDRIPLGSLPVAVQKLRERQRNMRNGVPVGKHDKELYESVLGG